MWDAEKNGTPENRRPQQDTANHRRTLLKTAGLLFQSPDTAGLSYKVQTGPSNDRRTPQDIFSVPLKGAF